VLKWNEYLELVVMVTMEKQVDKKQIVLSQW